MKDKVRKLSNGQYVKIVPVQPFLLDGVQSRVPMPKPPVVKTDRGDFENYDDPGYKAAVAAAEEERTRRLMTAVITLGMRLCDENGKIIKPPEGWQEDLEFMGMTLDDMIEENGLYPKSPKQRARAEEAIYIKYICFSGEDASLIQEISGEREMAIEEEEARFPS